MRTRLGFALAPAILAGALLTSGTACKKPAILGGAPAKRAWSRVEKEIDAEGRISKEGALLAFSLHFGALPDVKDVPEVDDSVPRCSTVATMWLLDHWKALTPEQREAVKKKLTREAPPAPKVSNAVTFARGTAPICSHGCARSSSARRPRSLVASDSACRAPSWSSSTTSPRG